ncbi:hypothetical protein [Roseovarius aquimarinus]|uniref:Sarcosine oxidase, gamma subunit family n=1 Tax=Roseovarius aquimarinus TaxID=1229156 RepID=A0ABW7I5Y9_9RHOB
MTDQRRMADAVRSARHGHLCRAGAPFARLDIGPRGYEIAHSLGPDGPDGTLAFRAEGHQEWCALDRRIACGWTAIAADILLLDPDVLFDFLQTHALRRKTEDGSAMELDFDTLGVAWSARLLQDRDGEVSVAGGPWHHARLGLRAPAEGRARAIMLLLAAVPDARSMFEPHVGEWAYRIAQGVRVTPIL